MPEVVAAALAALLASRPIGHQVQKHVTTNGDVGGLTIDNIHRVAAGGLTVHMVRTSSGE